ncbi:Hypothetical protein ETEE_0582 [Edwardsiella anguillarum ET080813]|uniref:Uncharacterized protein n=1 Tax=Edwardsiella anguillarum ET080813 TaxID=667120 RepID=A0A076LG21_9GAMM|nr:Hypothetical protein ETEE_0582 [Edwardsiella anguillarum ET080813]
MLLSNPSPLKSAVAPTPYAIDFVSMNAMLAVVMMDSRLPNAND